MNDQQISLTLSVREVDLILAAIAKRPLEDVIDLFIKIKNQGAAQVSTPEVKSGD